MGQAAELDEALHVLVGRIRKKELIPSSKLALATLNAFYALFRNARQTLPSKLMETVRFWTKEISSLCLPNHIVAENIALRMLKIVVAVHRDAFEQKEPVAERAFPQLLRDDDSVQDVPHNDAEGDDQILEQFNLNLTEELQLLKNEMETVHKDIAKQSLHYIHSNETIMVHGHTKTIESFIKYIAKRRKFRVIVCQGVPYYNGHTLVRALHALSNIEITLIPDSSMYALMARVNKVFIGCDSISLDGSIRSFSGAHVMALAAKFYKVPVVVCSGIYKFSPRYIHSFSVSGRDTSANCLDSPQYVIDFYSASAIGQIDVLNPIFDHVPADLINIFITNIGSKSPCYMSRLLQELYQYDSSFPLL